MPRCRDCKAEITWARSEHGEHGKNMPFDREPSASGTYKLIEGNPLTASYVKEQNRHLEPVLHVPHWSTCPNAERFRNRGRVAPTKVGYYAYALCPECGRKFYGVLADSKCGDCLDLRDRVVNLVEARLEREVTQ
jgi:hypothetical protein